MDRLSTDRHMVHHNVSQGIAALKAVRLAVADVIAEVDPLQTRLAFIAAKAGRLRREGERQALEAECREIESSVSEARAALILRLMDAPAPVAGHSRVLDIEKALDSIERSLKETRHTLANVSRISGRLL